MSRVPKLACLLGALAWAAPVFAADHEGVAPKAANLTNAHGLITNSMVTSWIVAVVVIILVRLAVRKPKLVPTAAQAIVESLVQGVLDLTGPIVGSRVAQKTLPLLIGLFTYILAQNWSGLFPGVGTVLMKNSAGHWIEFVRPGNADLNGTIALAVVSMVCWLYFILRYAGIRAVVSGPLRQQGRSRGCPRL